MYILSSIVWNVWANIGTADAVAAVVFVHATCDSMCPFCQGKFARPIIMCSIFPTHTQIHTRSIGWRLAMANLSYTLHALLHSCQSFSNADSRECVCVGLSTYIWYSLCDFLWNFSGGYVLVGVCQCMNGMCVCAHGTQFHSGNNGKDFAAISTIRFSTELPQ